MSYTRPCRCRANGFEIEVLAYPRRLIIDVGEVVDHDCRYIQAVGDPEGVSDRIGVTLGWPDGIDVTKAQFAGVSFDGGGMSRCVESRNVTANQTDRFRSYVHSR